MLNKFLISSFVLLLFGCTTEENESKLNDSPNQPQTQTLIQTSNELKIPLNEAKLISQNIIEEVHSEISTIYEILDFESEQTNDLIKEQLIILKPIATDTFIEQYLTIEDVRCNDDICSERPATPVLPYLGWKHEIQPIDEHHFSSSTIFPVWSDEGQSIQSYRQTVQFIFTEGNWKIDGFSNEDADMNLKEEDLSNYLIDRAYSPLDIEAGDTVERYGREEEIFTFLDYTTDWIYQIFTRTGYVEYIGDKRQFVIDNPIDYQFLLEDVRIDPKQIDSYTNESQQILVAVEELDYQWPPIISEDHRPEMQMLHSAYLNLLSQTYDYLNQFYPMEDGVSEFDQSFRSWNASRQDYFNQYGVDYFLLDEVEIDYLIEDTVIIRNQICNLIIEYSP